MKTPEKFYCSHCGKKFEGEEVKDLFWYITSYARNAQWTDIHHYRCDACHEETLFREYTDRPVKRDQLSYVL